MIHIGLLLQFPMCLLGANIGTLCVFVALVDGVSLLFLLWTGAIILYFRMYFDYYFYVMLVD